MRRTTIALASMAMALCALAPTASADFGLESFDVTFTNANGTPVTQAGAHPFAMTTTFSVNTRPDPTLGEIPDEAFRNFDFAQIEGLIGNPTAVPACTTLEFIDHVGIKPSCADSSVVGIVEVQIVSLEDDPVSAPVYNLVPPPGVAAKLGFWAINTPVTIEVGVNETHPFNIIGRGRNIPQTVPFYSSVFTLWGNPADPAHDIDRGLCVSAGDAKCPAGIAIKPFLTVPRSCEGPLETTYEISSWLNPPGLDSGFVLTHDQGGTPQGFLGCGKLGFSPEIEAQPTSQSAESPTGLDFNLRFDDEGLTSPDGLAQSEIKKAVVTLPEGMTANPSLAEGLGACSLAQYESERIGTPPGAGCPNQSKIGTIEVKSPLLEGKTLNGSLHIAAQNDPDKAGKENPFDSLLALYMVFRSPELGILIKQAGKVEPDPQSGQLVSTFENVPQLPFSDFELHFREGGRSPLVSPPRCGSYEAKAVFTPWANPDNPYTTTSSFQVTRGPNGGPCPPPGTQPFAPGFEAGSANNNAASYTPFQMRLTRRDGDQDITRFDALLPPGVVAKLAGVAKCSDAQIALAKTKSGRAELASPSCPASSQIGQLRAGAGVGSQLVYVPGSIYLAGPFAGAPTSVVAITPAVAGPFDVGTVVVRQALQVDPRSAEVTVDGSLSDPIPHILAGIPLRVRDIQVYVDRPQFTLNPTSCDPFQTAASIWGGGADVFAKGDDAPVSRSSRFQAANCSRLGFKPRLTLRLRGGTKRGGHPALRAILRPRAGDANIERTVVRLPSSAFLDQAHIRTICTRVQFAADACPPGAVYGHVQAFSPLLDEPLKGPAYLRSSNNKLPDLVFDLRGLVDIESSARIDSIRGGIRASFEGIPDAPLSKVVVDMQGGRKGLIVNSRDLCQSPSRAEVLLGAHNGVRLSERPKMGVRCGKGRGAKRR
ncbi:MAG TPA: hypothetical protein VNP96_09305 [Solirubrobacterales bacterium]|nr:hypothetical protein [Solirubrobacterales bacterium]